MRILHFGSNYLPSKGGNVVRMTNMLENNYMGNELFVMTTARRNSFDDEAYFARTGIRIIRIADFKEAKKILPLIVEEYAIDIVVTHVIPANLIACRMVANKVTVMTEVHSLIDSGRLKNFLKACLHRFFLNRKTKRYFVLSMGAREYLIKHYGVKPDKIVFLPNGYDRKSVVQESGREGFFTFGYVGTFYHWQGIDVILENVDKILAIAPDVRIYLVGGGYGEEMLKKRAEELGGRLIVTGLVDKSEVQTHMKEIDVLMIPRPSTLETETAIPLKIFDSIESGKPVIISDVFGLVEVLGENEAFVYSRHRAEGLSEACREAYENQNLRNDRFDNAVRKLEKWPTWSQIHERQQAAFLESKETDGAYGKDTKSH